MHKLRADGMDETGSIFGRTDLAAIARGFGLRGVTVTDVGQFQALFDAYQAQDVAELWNIDVSDRVVAALISLTFAAIVACGAVSAQPAKTGGPTPSPEGAGVHFVGLNDGATVPTKATVRFGLRGMGVAPAGLDRDNSGHHHLLIDTELPPLDQPIPNDFNHLHFGAGQTEADVTLKPGAHTLQLLFGDKDHVPHSPPLMSPRIRVVVLEPPGARTTPTVRKKRARRTTR